MFQFRRFPTYAYLIQRRLTEYCSAGFPHSEIRGYNAYVRLPTAYRSLSRPSSAPDAKAFPLRSYQLDLVGVSSRLHLLILKNYVQITEKFKFRLLSLYPSKQLSPFIVVSTTCFFCLFCCLLFIFILRCSVFKVLSSDL